MDRKVESTKCFLYSKDIHIDSRNQWFKNCVQWFVEENSSANIHELHTFVYDQLLLADLRDIQLNCLPVNVLEQEELILTGKYTLQIDSIQDVSQSCYSQIQKIRGTGKNVNIENQDPRSRNHADSDYLLKASHMLKLNMTDGAQHVFGMEYELLAPIRAGFIPGCKIVLSGPIEVRRGVFFIKAANFHLLGGELDSIIIHNSVENVLARILKLKENPNAGPVNIMSDLTNELATQTPSGTRPSPNLPSNIGNNQSSNQSHQTINNLNQTSTRTELSYSRTKHLNNYNTSTPENEINDWEDDDLMDMNVWNDIDFGNLALQTASLSNNTVHHKNSSNDPSITSTTPTNRIDHTSSSIADSSSNNFPSSSCRDLCSSTPTVAPNLRNTVQNINNLNPNNFNPNFGGSTTNSTNLKRYPSSELTPPAKRLHSCSNHSETLPLLTTPSPPTSSVAPPLPLAPPSKMCLARIKSSPPALPFSIVFRGCKVKSLEKLSVSKGAWRLPATITDDGVEFLSVVFSDTVIFNISGVSATELQSKKKQVSTDLQLRKSIEEMVQNIRVHILNYEGSMKILFTANQKPNVVSLPK